MRKKNLKENLFPLNLVTQNISLKYIQQIWETFHLVRRVPAILRTDLFSQNSSSEIKSQPHFPTLSLIHFDTATNSHPALNHRRQNSAVEDAK